MAKYYSFLLTARYWMRDTSDKLSSFTQFATIQCVLHLTILVDWSPAPLLRDVDTHWSSILYMIDQLIINYPVCSNWMSLQPIYFNPCQVCFVLVTSKAWNPWLRHAMDLQHLLDLILHYSPIQHQKCEGNTNQYILKAITDMPQNKSILSILNLIYSLIFWFYHVEN